MLNNILDRIKESPDEAFVERLFSEEEAKSIFNWNDVTNLLRTNTRYFEIIEKNHTKLQIPGYAHDWHGIYGTIQDKQFILDNIKAGNGFTILGQACYNEKIYDLSKTMEESLNQALDAHVYGAYVKTAKSFKAHSDPSLNIILQMDGTSLWRVYAEKRHDIPPDILDVTGQLTEHLTETFSIDLTPGMMLYIPRWLYHKCEPKTKRLSISFAMMDIQIRREPRMNFNL